MLKTLKDCQHPDGGFGGGPNQMPHLAATFAAVSALGVLGTLEAYALLNRSGLLAFLNAMHQPDGSFIMQTDGEACCRGCYCAVACGALTGLLGQMDLDGTAEFIAACQTYEGGIGAVPFAEAHAGYSYCGFAALSLMGKAELVDARALAAFAARSQCLQSGGFRGRTNKLVDGCYSFWTGALFPLTRACLADLPSFDGTKLQEYLLICAQNTSTGGLKDKPEKREDYYHTCYGLAGMALAQQEPSSSVLGLPENRLVRGPSPLFRSSLAHLFCRRLSIRCTICW